MPDVADQVTNIWAIASVGAFFLGGAIVLLRPFIPDEEVLRKRVSFARENLVAKLGSQLENVLASHAAEIQVQMPTDQTQPGTARPKSKTVEEWADECFRGMEIYSDLKRMFRSLTITHHLLYLSMCLAVMCFLVGWLVVSARLYVGTVAIADVIVQLGLVGQERLLLSRFGKREDVL